MSATEQSPSQAKLPRVLSLIVVVIGLVMLVAGAVIYGVTSSQLRAQGVSVAAVTASAPGSLAGKPVAGPFTALAQINAIKHHTSTATGGKTYGQIAQVPSDNGFTYNADVTADKASDGQAHAAGSPLDAADAKAWAVRSTAQQSSFLQASLLLSVLAFGVATFIMGTGLTVAIVGIALYTGVARRRKQTTAPATEEKELQYA